MASATVSACKTSSVNHNVLPPVSAACKSSSHNERHHKALTPVSANEGDYDVLPRVGRACLTSRDNKGDSNVLPEFLALRSPNNNKFVGYRTDPAYRGLVRVEYDDIWSPYVKLQVVNDNNSGFISIRCCYNNKFWARWKRDSNPWIVAGENSVNSDSSTVACTLFDFSYEIPDNILCLRMVQCNKYAADWKVGGELDRCLFAGENPGQVDSFAKFVVHDMDSMVRLPKYVAFKGDNGMYLGYASVDNFLHLVFNERDLGSEGVAHKVHCTGDGKISLMCMGNSRFWHWNNPANCLTVNCDCDNCRNRPSLFQLVKVDDHTVALRCLDNRLFCRRLYHSGCSTCFLAFGKSIDSAARLVVTEPVISRKIYSIEYDLDGSYVYGVQPLVLATVRATNDSPGTATLTVPISYTERSTRSWNNVVSFTAGVEAKVTAAVPFIAGGTVTVSAQASYTHEWGGQSQVEKTVGSSYTATVESGKTLVVKAIATMAKCDLKFSYIQKDVLTNGEVITTKMHDGVFIGMNYYDVKYKSEIEK